ncbi:helix-turn-helix transcriptional regulator [Leptolyngbya sp. FACHB-671]|uniref:AraC family transcriptional regulator n=1 Tax=Leptolyngbya sp. FACHB-671 TaxID=2692812 RepID=UPI001686E736|nr:AraC family transcriptional regulator [Leptolyngbya sp. FACHB-671]MBD1871379.1 helix-turn-helix transcriptional regulator [Cyanobacteria bacterium FACHB-471]MBD2072056.1 helix-turn-helix transcriptional regulator [Leptolyngbya sp. FACHB-671]
MQHTIKGWLFEDILLEFYRYAPCPPEWLPEHCHDEYQFCLSLDCPGEYYYRGTHYWVPTNSLSVIHPGEMHTGRDIEDRQTAATFRMLYISSNAATSIASDVAEKEINTPFFAEPIILNVELAQHYLEFHKATQGLTSRLEQDSLLQSLIAQLVVNHTNAAVELRPTGSERKATQRVREYLQNQYGENVTLNRLAEIAGLSSYYLSRVFKAEVGISLKQYQSQIRINRAKILISQGISLQQVATDTGFVDQSHLTHHFKRFVQTTPGQYRLQDRKNLQDRSD